MLELIEIVRNGLPLNEAHTWLFFATVLAAGIAGAYAGTAAHAAYGKKGG